MNNLGEIVLRCNYVSKSKSKYSNSHGYTEREYTEIKGTSSLEYTGKYEEVEAWFEKTYPESVWINKNWENVQIIRGDKEELQIIYWVRPNLLMF